MFSEKKVYWTQGCTHWVLISNIQCKQNLCLFTQDPFNSLSTPKFKALTNEQNNNKSMILMFPDAVLYIGSIFSIQMKMCQL